MLVPFGHGRHDFHSSATPWLPGCLDSVCSGEIVGPPLPEGRADGQIAQWNATTAAWVCADKASVRVVDATGRQVGDIVGCSFSDCRDPQVVFEADGTTFILTGDFPYFLGNENVVF